MWLYVPASCLSAPAWPDSTSESISQFQERGLWATSSGKHSARPFSWPGWKRRPWISRLSGATLPLSTAVRGVDRWISSVQGSHASHGASPDSDAAPQTSDGSGPTLRESFATWHPESSSWRTSGAFWPEECPESLGIWPASGSMRSGECSRRRKSARRISGRDASCWPTATSQDSGSSGYSIESGRHPGTTLTDAIRAWPTPDAAATTRSNRSPSPGAATRPALAKAAETWPTPNAHDAGTARSASAEMKDRHHKPHDLQNAAMAWPTPCAGAKGPGGEGNREGGPTLNTEAARWPTPDTSHVTRSEEGRTHPDGRLRQVSLDDVASSWPTPATNPQAPNKNSNTVNGPTSLEEAAQLWATPNARDWKSEDGTHSPEHSPPLGRQVLMIGPGGKRGSEKAALCPLFVEALMGWPRGWTDFEPVEMASWRSKQRSLLSSLLGVPGDSRRILEAIG